MTKHDFVKDKYGNVDVWQVEFGYHNGPRCIRCGKTECHHCSDWENEECPSGQLDLFEA